MTIKTFTTALATYTIELDHNRRVDRFEDGVAVWEDVTTYRIMKDGKLLTVCYDERLTFLWSSTAKSVLLATLA